VTVDRRAFHLELPGATPSVPLARRAVTRWLAGAPAASEDDLAAIRLAVTEALANAVEHGGGTVTVTAVDRRGSVLAVVRDRGRWPTDGGTVTAVPPPVAAERGRGLTLLGACVDQVEVAATRTGTSVAFVRHLGVPARATVAPRDR
jgi:anti-sigma regulatory factor (Ser/Thr protein kinase)